MAIKIAQIKNTPGGKLAQRPLEFFFVIGCSGSMSGDKIESLNVAMKSAIPAMQSEANQNPSVLMFIRVIEFSTGAQWHISNRTEVESFSWSDLQAGGQRDMGAAFELLSVELEIPPMPRVACPPFIVLISDGYPTDDWKFSLEILLSKPWAQEATRVAIAIGADFDMLPLKSFTTGNLALENSTEILPHQIPLIAKNADQLAKYIKWAEVKIDLDDDVW